MYNATKTTVFFLLANNRYLLFSHCAALKAVASLQCDNVSQCFACATYTKSLCERDCRSELDRGLSDGTDYTSSHQRQQYSVRYRDSTHKTHMQVGEWHQFAADG